ncbi:hypothetical protein ACFPH6_19555 [Streptomyces xiangluensis]|uniref:Tail assembly chaperone n=1 Tax=Streptomyces xiangluensis TaxID=2665720 RepID=A0ABV8YQ49_9ACTN
MSRRRKGRKDGRRAQRSGRVYVQTAHGDKVLMPNMTAEQYDRVKELAEAGELHAPEILGFVRAFADLIGAPVDFEGWTPAERAEFLVAVLGWLGFVSGDEWTPADDNALAALLEEVNQDGWG